MKLLEQIKLSQRISHNALDDILLSDIYAGADELSRAGVEPYETDDTGQYLTDENGYRIINNKPLIRKAIELYAKCMEDFEEKGSTYMTSFEKLRDSMSLSGGYNAQRND